MRDIRISSLRIFSNYWVRFVGIVAVYVAAGVVGLDLASVNHSVTPIWAPTGIAIASLLLFGYRMWPAIFLGAVCVTLTTHGVLLGVVSEAVGNTLEPLAAAYLINRLASGKAAFEKVRTILLFSLIVGFLSTPIAASIGSLTLLFIGKIPASAFSSVWFVWWMGDVGGAILVAPLLLLWFSKPVTIKWAMLIEFSLFLLVVVGIAGIVFSGILPYAYICIPILVFGAFYFEQRGEVIALFVVATIATFFTVHGFGPYANNNATASLLELEAFLAVYAMTIYIITAVFTERKEAKQALEVSERKFHSLIEKSSDVIVLVDEAARIMYVSPSVERVLGYAQQELLGKSGLDFTFSADVPKATKSLQMLLAKPSESITITYRLVRKDGQVVWIEAIGTNLLGDPAVHAIVVNFKDITKDMLRQQRLEEDKATDEAILTSIGEGMVVVDSSGKIVLANDTACEMLGYSKKQLVGKHFITRVAMEKGGKTLLSKDRPMVKALQAGKKSISADTYYIRSDGSKIPVRCTTSPVIINNKIVGSIEIFRDMTQDLAVDRVKTEFVSLASHQLRTPLTTIEWYIERLLANELQSPKQQKQYLQEVHRASLRMIDLINALLNASRLELGTFIANPQPTSLEGSLFRSLAGLEKEREQKHIIIEQHIGSNMPLIAADPKLLAIIFDNLLSNAIKYSRDRSKVVVAIQYDAKGYTVSVTDSGCGIPVKDYKKMFTKMFRADNAKEIDPNGTGLGLYIVKSIVDATGGKISFTSQENTSDIKMQKGKTVFTVWYPAEGMRRKVGTKELH